MIAYNNQNVLKQDALPHKVEPGGNTFKPSQDPLLDMEYVSPVNQGCYSTIGRLESGVSLLQTASLNIEKIRNWLQELKQFLEGDGNVSYRSTIPTSVTNKYIEDRLMLIRHLVNTASFGGKKVLNGDYGIKANVSGERLKFVRGSARVESSGEEGYKVAIFQVPKPSFLLGAGHLEPDEIEKERFICLTDGTQELRYRLRSNETADSLVEHLQQLLLENNFDVSVFRSKDNRLFFKHNQLGSRNTFHGKSSISRLISQVPDQYESATIGIDVAGTIGGESAHGDGGFLIGDKDNKNTDGLVVYFDGDIDHPGQFVGRVNVVQNGITVPLDVNESKLEMLSIPSIDPKILAQGLSTNNRFSNLNSIKVTNENERRDALKMIAWSRIYLGYLVEELKAKEDSYVDLTMEMLRGGMATLVPIQNESLCLSKEKANDMVEQLKGMLSLDPYEK